MAVDGFSWLHKGAYSCAREVVLGEWTDKFLRYVMGRIETLVGNGVEPIVVFDGGRLPMKADEEDSRRKSRRDNKGMCSNPPYASVSLSEDLRHSI